MQGIKRNVLALSCAAWFLSAPVAFAASTAELLSTLKNVDRAGKGNALAAQALKELTRQNAEILPEILNAFEGANPLAVNYLRSAFETVADQSVKRNQPLPIEQLKVFLLDPKEDRQARRLAFEWLQTADPQTAERLIPGFLQDPSGELRREAVAKLIKEAQVIDAKKTPALAVAVYRKALSGAVDDDQVKQIVEPLKKLGETVDLPRHFGFLTDWHLIGPFDNRQGVGFAAVYPPEEELHLEAIYDTTYDDGFEGGKVRWQPFSTKDNYGLIDVGKDVKNHKGSCTYAVAEFFSTEARPVEIRLGTPNAWKLWVNGKPLFAREEYHRGARMDQYRVAAPLNKGRNLILVKICQNEQTDDWAQRYQVQLRVCDPAGSAILSESK